MVRALVDRWNRETLVAQGLSVECVQESVPGSFYGTERRLHLIFG